MTQESGLKLRFMPGVRIQEIMNGKLMVFFNGDRYCIQDPLYIEFLKYMDNKNEPLSIQDIHHHLIGLGSSISSEKLQQIAEEMIQISIVSIQESILPHPIQTFLSKIGVSQLDAIEKLKNQKISVYSYSTCPAAQLEESLHHLNIQTGDQGTFSVLLVDDYLHTDIRNFNQKAKQQNMPWMLIKPDSLSFWVGPIFNSNNPLFASYESLAWRLQENRMSEVDAFGTDSPHFNLPSPISFPNARASSLNMAAMEIFKWIVSGTSGLISNILTYDCTNLTIGFHYVDRHPFDKDVMAKDLSDSSVVRLKLNPSEKIFFDPEGARSRTPDDTLSAVEHLVSPITGLLDKMSYIKQNNCHFYFGSRCPNFSDRIAIKGHIRPMEGVVGKSVSQVKAKVGCIAEAVERYFSANHELHPERVASYREIGEQAIHPQILLNLSREQYEKRDMINSSKGPFQWIPLPFNETEKMHWLHLASLNSEKESYILSAYCYMRQNTYQEQLICPGDTNGCACGNTLEEAIFYGLAELIERDAVAIWWYNRLIRPTVDLASFSNPMIDDAVHSLKALGRCLRVIDITTDINIPTFLAISWRNDGSRMIFGSSAHLNPQTAIIKALNELAQTLTRADILNVSDLAKVSIAEKEFTEWVLQETVEKHPFLAQESRVKGAKDYSYYVESQDFHEDLKLCFNLFRERQLDIYAVPLTPKKFPLTVVKVIVPTMRHFWGRLGEGRLYQVPVSLGDFKQPLREDELNPVYYFL